jgi:hypothetical protein
MRRQEASHASNSASQHRFYGPHGQAGVRGNFRVRHTVRERQGNHALLHLGKSGQYLARLFDFRVALGPVTRWSFVFPTLFQWNFRPQPRSAATQAIDQRASRQQRHKDLFGAQGPIEATGMSPYIEKNLLDRILRIGRRRRQPACNGPYDRSIAADASLHGKPLPRGHSRQERLIGVVDQQTHRRFPAIVDAFFRRLAPMSQLFAGGAILDSVRRFCARERNGRRADDRTDGRVIAP